MKIAKNKWYIIIMVIGLIFSIFSLLFISICHADEVKSQTIMIVTAYNAGDPKQTDDTPCIDASNTNICKALNRGEKRCATNFVKLGTVLDIENFGKCIVTDRTNRRYKYRVDIAFKKHERKKALKFGRKKLLVKVLKKIEKIN
jgi:3D (Asp-Asp-Asp) domain-containing protein